MNRQEMILKSLKHIEQMIYWLPYDDLDEYLKGVRDIINLLNGEEDNNSIENYIIEKIDTQIKIQNN